MGQPSVAALALPAIASQQTTRAVERTNETGQAPEQRAAQYTECMEWVTTAKTADWPN